MKNALTLATLTLVSLNLWGSNEVIYGVDDRKDYFEVSNDLHRKLADSTAAMVHFGLFEIDETKNTIALSNISTLEESMNVCPSEKFSQQKAVAKCSGFLVGEDILVTAGHCYKSILGPEFVCNSFAWVFDYHLKSPHHNPHINIPEKNIYFCSKVIKAEFNRTMDYAIIKLHKKVTGRTPLEFRTSGKISNNTPLLVIGHPSGLPQKISPGGIITINSRPTTFQTTLDTFKGNSGSAVFDARTGLVEGILTQGKTDYVNSIKDDPRSCLVVNRCDNNAMGCLQDDYKQNVASGEVVQRITNLSKSIQNALEGKEDISFIYGDRPFAPASKL